MKKRVKLLMTIASLCLAFAIMAFGVYAATSVTATTTSTVTFTAEDVYVNIKVEYFLSASDSDDSLGAATATYTGRTYSNNDGNKSTATSAPLASISWSPSAPEAQEASYSSTNKVVTVKITLQNALPTGTAFRSAYFSISALPATSADASSILKTTNSTATLTVGGSAYSTADTPIELLKGTSGDNPGAEVVIKYQRTLINLTQSFSQAIGWTASIKIGNTSALVAS